MELSNGYFPDCSILILKQQKESSDSKTDILLNHETGRDLNSYLIKLPYPPFPSPNNSVIEQVIVKGNFNTSKSVTSLLSPSLPKTAL